MPFVGLNILNRTRVHYELWSIPASNNLHPIRMFRPLRPTMRNQHGPLVATAAVNVRCFQNVSLQTWNFYNTLETPSCDSVPRGSRFNGRPHAVTPTFRSFRNTSRGVYCLDRRQTALRENMQTRRPLGSRLQWRAVFNFQRLISLSLTYFIPPLNSNWELGK